MNQLSGNKYHHSLSTLRSFIAILLLSILSGCDIDSLPNPLSPFQWAVVDQTKVISALKKIAYEQNPYPEDPKGDEPLRVELRNLDRQIRNLRTIAIDRCMKAEKEKYDAEKLSSSDQITIRVPGIRYDPSSPHAKCENKVSEDQLINDLIKKQAKINLYFKQKGVHERKVRESVSVALRLVIEAKFEDEFDLILIQRKEIVLYNKSSLVVDVTEKLLEHINSTDIKIPVK